jgi:hypothetical protein
VINRDPFAEIRSVVTSGRSVYAVASLLYATFHVYNLNEGPLESRKSTPNPWLSSAPVPADASELTELYLSRASPCAVVPNEWRR